MEEIKVIKEDKIKIKKDNDKKVLKKLIKTDEWEKVKDIKEIYDEIRDYDIDKEDIGLNCSKYLNKVGDSGLFEIDELYNTCYRLKALRQKRLKKEKKEKAPKQPKGGRGRGGAGSAGVKQTKDTDIDKSKVQDITTQINKSIDKHFNKETGSFDYAGFFAEISGSICLNGIKNGLTAVSKSFKENWEKIDDIGWSGSVWNIGKNTATELMKVVAQCPKQALGLAGFTSIGLALSFFKSVFGSIVNMVKRIGNPPSTDDDDADDDAGSGAVGTGGASGGLTRRTPQAGGLSYTADDVEANRLNQQDLTQNKQSKQADLNASFQNIIKQQKENAVRQGRDSVNTIIETDIKSTDAYAPKPERQKQPSSQYGLFPPTEDEILKDTTEENIIKEPETTEETMIKDDMFRPSRGGMFSGMGFDTQRGEETGKEFTGRAGGKEFLSDAMRGYTLYKFGKKAMDYMGNPLVEPQPTQVPADDGLGFVDAEDIPDKAFRESRGIDKAQRTRDIKKSGDVAQQDPTTRKIEEEIDNMDKVAQGRGLFLSNAMSGMMGSDGSKLAQNAINPAVLYLRGQTENPTLKLQSVQSQTEEQTNPEMETLTRQMDEDLDVINNIIDNPNTKPTAQERDILDEQTELMRKAQTNITPKQQEIVNRLYNLHMMNIQDRDTPEVINPILRPMRDELLGNIRERATANTITDDIIQSVENRAIEEQERATANTITDDIIQSVEDRAEMYRNFEENIRPQLLSLQKPPRQPQELMSRASVQEPELDVREADASAMSLQPKTRGRKKGQTSSDMRVGMRLITGNPNQNDFGYKELLQLNNPIITQYINELITNRPTGSTTSKLSKEEGNELLKRLGKK